MPRPPKDEAPNPVHIVSSDVSLSGNAASVQPVSQSGGWTTTPNRGSLTNRGSTITSGGTSQTLMAANANRLYFLFENVSDTDMWIRPGGGAAAAATPSILVKANGGNFIMENALVSTEAWTVFCATTGKGYAAYEG